MKLYHGSNVPVEAPRLFQSDRRMDFGTGFYLTTSYEQAAKWAKLTTKRRKTGVPSISIYDVDEAAIEGLQVVRFERANENWLRFVSANRRNVATQEQIDIVCGPVANDNTMPVINLYFSGIYTEEEAIKRLLPQKLKDQYVFKTERAIELLHFCEVIQL